ncbi:MAG: diadenylate cyclase CdaA [Cyclobacteriaceae bacterium]|nr:diadenylate cyclase CdaA [Cyclobacteriaceae bacterium]MCH8516731.1 diadenylate cyclase CdaA [Cyclobacteriaceae bacterium]
MTILFQIGFLEISWVDIFDITLVAILLYQVYKLMKGSVAVKIFLGFLSLYLFYLVVSASEMELLSNILGQFMGVGVLAAIILFQQEIRKFLLVIGKTTQFNRENILKNLPWKKNDARDSYTLNPIIEATKSLGAKNTGALIVFSKNTELKFIAETGDAIDALVSKRLLIAIFNKTSPLHDGALIIYKNRIKAARCLLPTSEQENIPAQYGTRHRAAIGLSETSDALVLVVSEETGQVSIALNGDLFPNLSSQEVRKRLQNYLFEESDNHPKEVSKKMSEPKKGETKKEKSTSNEEEPNVADLK